jgi:hypothetical protein
LTPDQGAPPALVEGKLYEAGGPAFNANGGRSVLASKTVKLYLKASSTHKKGQARMPVLFTFVAIP